MKQTMKQLLFFLFTSILIIPVNNIDAIVSNEIYFQSILLDSNETVVADGQYTVTFSLWDGEQETDNKLWVEQHLVSVENGIYVVSLGSIVPFLDPDQNGDQSDALSFAIPYFLGVTIDNNPIFTFDGKFPGLRSVVSAFRTRTSAGNLIKSVNTTYAVTENDDVLLVSGNTTITLPSANNLRGRIFTIKNNDPTNTTSLKTVSSETIDNVNCDTSNGGTALILPDQHDEVTVISNGQNWVSLGFKT